MNILPHKSWHVRTKKNIARVKKDQAQAAEEEKEKQRRIALAAQEARTTLLRNRANIRIADSNRPDLSSNLYAAEAEGDKDSADEPKSKSEAPLPYALSEIADITQSDGHINFFQDIEDGKKQESGVNQDHEEEKKAEKEEYENKIGLLVYLGQNSLEQTKDKPWYETVKRPKDFLAGEAPTTDKDLKVAKLKDFQDPLKDIRGFLSSPAMNKNKTANHGPPTKVFVPASSSTSAAPKRKAPDDDPISSKKSKLSKEKKHKRSSSGKKHKHKNKKHHKKHHQHKRSTKSDSESNEEEDDSEEEEEKQKKLKLEKLRAERLEREREERRKAEKLLAKVRGDVLPVAESEETRPHGHGHGSTSSGEIAGSNRKQKYNSQFNPHLARQNY